MSERKNLQVILLSRPGVDGEPQESNFGIQECPSPTSASLAAGDVLVKNLFLSVDPALRCRMNEDSGVHYMSAWQLGQGIDGLGGVGKVMSSNDSVFQEGDLVTGTFLWPWTAEFTILGNNLRKLPKEIFGNRPSLALSLLGGTGLTAYLGIVERAHLRQGGNQTVVVSAAGGATGSLAGQIAHLLGAAQVVGICGSEEKCRVVREEFGFDCAINYKTTDVAAELMITCPEGVHVYFDNVGGDLSTSVIKQMVSNSHVILCGQIAMYNQDVPYPPPVSAQLQEILQQRNITRERFLVLDFTEKFEAALQVLAKWYDEGKIKVRETTVEGLENAGAGFVSMMKGGNIGKQIVRVADM